jgi:carbon-monoxide dehydrogenase medium subunit
MKPAPFEYYAPKSIEQSLAHLSEHGYDAKVLAGGQSLIPMMNFRLAEPSVLIDLNNIPELAFILPNENGGLRIGTMTRHSQAEKEQLVAKRAPLLFEAMPQIATTQIRSRGTIGGSIAHADPSAELVAVSVALGARFKIKSLTGERWIPAKDFFLGMFATSLEPDEILAEIELPSLPPRTGWALEEIARRPHDFAMVGVAVLVTLSDDNLCQKVRLVYLSVGDGPVEAKQAEQVLRGESPNPDILREASETAASVDIDPGSDIHASANFRRHLAKILTQRALAKAFERARSVHN